VLDNLACDVLDAFWVLGSERCGVEGDNRGRGPLVGGGGQDRGSSCAWW